MSQEAFVEPPNETQAIHQPDLTEPTGDSDEPEIVDQASEAEHEPEPSARKQSFLIPTLFLLLIGGLIGWIIGRQSITTDRAAANLITVTTVAPSVVAQSVPTTGSPVKGGAPGDNDSASTNNRVFAAPTPASIITETLKALGNPNAPVKIVEFSDYQCPFCLRNFQQVYPQLKADYIDTGKVYYVFKDFPIPSLHPVSPRVHEAARCVGALGGSKLYWQAHDSFFTNQSQWANKPQPDLDNILIDLTQAVGAPKAKMRECLANNRYADAVKADMAEGAQLNVTGTPTFFINGYPVIGAQPYNVFQQAIALAEQGRLGEAFAQAAQAQPPAAPQPAQNPASALTVTVPLGDAPGQGNPKAPVTLVEYSDFQCPFCLRHFTTTMPQLQSYIDAGQVYFVFKDFPLESLHPQSEKAHESARCARELGGDKAFWSMHDLLFTNQQQWANNSDHINVFKALAVQAGLPQAEFNQCLDSGRYEAAVRASIIEGQQLGIRGTPTFFINGRTMIGAQPFSAFQRVIGGLLGH